MWIAIAALAVAIMGVAVWRALDGFKKLSGKINGLRENRNLRDEEIERMANEIGALRRRLESFDDAIRDQRARLHTLEHSDSSERTALHHRIDGVRLNIIHLGRMMAVHRGFEEPCESCTGFGYFFKDGHCYDCQVCGGKGFVGRAPNLAKDDSGGS